MMKCIYRGVEYFVIAIRGDVIEIAPTKHGAGSFYTTLNYVRIV